MNNQKLSLDEIKAKSIRGIAALTGRTFLIQIVTLISTFLLTIFLDPKEYGIFFLIGAIINFFVYFSDIGLAAALIQKKDSPNDDELKTTFSIQQLLVVTIVSLIFLLTPIFKNIFSLDTEAIYLLWALSFSLFLSSLKTIPSVLLERKLDFNKLIIPQIVETLFFYTTCVFLAWKGYGISSFTFQF